VRLERQLGVRDVSVHFGGFQALKGISFELRPGTVTALIGPNGAGKTTAVNVISGTQRPSSGSIVLDGRDISHLPAHARPAIARTFQLGQIFRDLTVLENVMVGLHTTLSYGFVRAGARTRKVRELERRARERALELLGDVHIEHLAERDAATLQLGQERLLEVARALAADAGVILLDEVASGLTMEAQQGIGGLLARMRERGSAVLVVEHDMRFVKHVADRLVVLDLGEVIYDGDLELGLRDEHVVSAYLGTRMS
jgi:branched-chain amino acid transport system ATP-binding protein